jgi:hypothetical protein
MTDQRPPHPLATPEVVGVSVDDLHFGVVSGEGKPGDALNTTAPIVYGTAFCFAPGGLFLTAGHVLEDALKDAGPNGVVGLFRRSGKSALEGGPVTCHELHRGIDMALLLCPFFRRAIPFPIAFDELDLLTPVSAIGFPLAVDTERLALVARGFLGHVVTRRELYQLPAQPPGYEVSFPCPRGLSGAPLVQQRRDGAWCVGYVVQNWRYASGDYTAGVAVACDALLSIESKMLNRPLARLFGLEPRPLRSPTPVRNPLMVRSDTSVEGWPDDDIPEDKT